MASVMFGQSSLCESAPEDEDASFEMVGGNESGVHGEASLRNARANCARERSRVLANRAGCPGRHCPNLNLARSDSRTLRGYRALMTFDDFLAEACIEFDNQKTPDRPLTEKDTEAFKQAMKTAWQNNKTPHEAVRDYLNA
jgi:hypothetical protein